MNADELKKKKLEQNSLAQGLTTLADRAKTGRLVNPKILAVAITLLIAGAVWWFVARQNRHNDSNIWKIFETATSAEEFAKIAADNPKSAAALPARFNGARVRLTAEGVDRFGSETQRAKAIEEVAKARDEFQELAKEFQRSGDRTLRCESLRLAAMAEMALVGIPKPGTQLADENNPASQRGTVAAAVAFLQDAAKGIGENTSAGEKLKAEAAALVAAQDKKDSLGMTPAQLGWYINGQIRAPEIPQFEPKPPIRPVDPPPLDPPTPPNGTRSTTPSTRR